jgi:hypothetical protein
MIRLFERSIVPSAIMAAWISAPSQAQDIAAQQAALKDIRETAAEICYTIPLAGEHRDVHLTGEADGQLAGVISRLANLGIKGAGQFNDGEYRGVLREQLAATVKDSSDCKRDVFKLLVDKMLPAPASAGGRQGINAGNIEQRTDERCSPAIVGAGNVDVKCQ